MLELPAGGRAPESSDRGAADRRRRGHRHQRAPRLRERSGLEGPLFFSPLQRSKA
jgi:hypothetical protein